MTIDHTRRTLNISLEESSAVGDAIARPDNVQVTSVPHEGWEKTRGKYFLVYADQMNKLNLLEHFTISDWPIPRCPPSVTVKVCRYSNGFILASILGDQIMDSISITTLSWHEMTMVEQVDALMKGVDEVVEPLRGGCS